MGDVTHVLERPTTPRVADLRARVRAAMEQEPAGWDCPKRIDERFMSEPLPVRKARAIALKPQEGRRQQIHPMIEIGG